MERVQIISISTGRAEASHQSTKGKIQEEKVTLENRQKNKAKRCSIQPRYIASLTQTHRRRSGELPSLPQSSNPLPACPLAAPLKLKDANDVIHSSLFPWVETQINRVKAGLHPKEKGCSCGLFLHRSLLSFLRVEGVCSHTKRHMNCPGFTLSWSEVRALEPSSKVAPESD